MRALALWLVLLAVYAAGIGLRVDGGERYTRAEVHRLLTVQSIAQDGSIDLTDEYRERSWRAFTGVAPVPTAAPVAGRLAEGQGIGLPLVLAGAYALGGATAVELWCAAIMALAFVLGAALARRVVPDPWATRGALLVGLSPPAVVGATSVAPLGVGAAAVAGAALCALAVRDQPRLRVTAGAAGLVAVLPWLAVRLAAPGAVVLLALARWLRRRRRGLTGFVALELVLTSAVVFITVNDRIFGGLLPGDAALDPAPATGLSTPGDLLERVPRLLGVLVDPDAGLLRWAPATALAGVGIILLWRSRRDRLADALPQRIDVEVAAGFLVVICAVAVGTAALLSREIGGDALIGGDLIVVGPVAAGLVAWGAQRAPRAAAVLGAVTAVLTGVELLGG